MSAPPDHPAVFHPQVIEAIREQLDGYFAAQEPPLVLDPFAGVGGIHALQPSYRTLGIELEPEWANAHPDTAVGNACATWFLDGEVDAVATSPCYGNRMADHHNAREVCKPCKGGGLSPTPGAEQWSLQRCPKCDGTGRRDHVRITYRHKLGRDLSPGSSAGLQWGPAYRRLHLEAWTEAFRVLRPGGLLVLNIKDHVRDGELQRVPEWHVQTIQALGGRLYRCEPVQVSGMGFGANRDARAEFELVVSFIAPGALTQAPLL